MATCSRFGGGEDEVSRGLSQVNDGTTKRKRHKREMSTTKPASREIYLFAMSKQHNRSLHLSRKVMNH